jgi:hypothetical protein
LKYVHRKGRSHGPPLPTLTCTTFVWLLVALFRARMLIHSPDSGTQILCSEIVSGFDYGKQILRQRQTSSESLKRHTTHTPSRTADTPLATSTAATIPPVPGIILRPLIWSAWSAAKVGVFAVGCSVTGLAWAEPDSPSGSACRWCWHGFRARWCVMISLMSPALLLQPYLG